MDSSLSWRRFGPAVLTALALHAAVLFGLRMAGPPVAGSPAAASKASSTVIQISLGGERPPGPAAPRYATPYRPSAGAPRPAQSARRAEESPAFADARPAAKPARQTAETPEPAEPPPGAPSVSEAPGPPAATPESDVGVGAASPVSLGHASHRVQTELGLGSGSAETVSAPAASSIPPSLRTELRPGYPWTARLAGHEGLVVVEVDIDAAGVVISARIAATSGYGELDQAALEAVRAARFEPAYHGARGVPSRVSIPVRFRLR